ncbi:Synaptonemal complex protein 2 [Echinococcus granulosus]|uniref:Synaptonemal complex protein 2 n=1 Tax=Echinococcus granulosus TaxID=6210 RepID=W6U7K7_ECHGR|nr:Synaptonemal complex protein 2 [Echinococcus granulosus]EUB56346.1 Synaptonemal complex protein 2 [Echinococcus granulosus]
MEAWISLLTLDSQTSSQVVAEENLREISKGLKSSDVLSKDSFSILVNALSEKVTCFESKPIPPDFFNVFGCLCEHLAKRKDLLPEDVRSFFASFVESILKVSPKAVAPVFKHMLGAFYPKIVDSNCNVYTKYSILAGINEISVLPSATKVELFLKPNIHGIYTSLASNMRSLGDYDTQTQLLEFLLHVIPAARRKDFVEEYLHRGLSEPFCLIIGQQFELAARRFLNMLNPVDPVTQTVFSIPCISVRLCGHELQCQPASSKSKDEPSWVDFNLVPERITTYCVMSMRSDSSCDSEEGEQTWETISLHPEVIEEVNVSSMRLESVDDGIREQIVLSISITEPSSNFARFWEGSNESDTADEKSVIEFFLNPPDVVKALPGDASANHHGSHSQQQQQLMELLTGLRAYAEKMFPQSNITSSQSSTDCQQQHPDVDSGSKVIYASCRSPLCVEVGEKNAPSPLPPPKSFFTDPDVSFEESAEGLGLKGITSGERPPRPIPLFRCQTVRTPLSLRVGPDGSVERQGRSATTIHAAAPSSRPVSSPFSVASGLETPSPCRRSLEAPNLEGMDTSLDEDIASESARRASAVECQLEEVEKSSTQSEEDTAHSQTPISRAKVQASKRSSSVKNLDPPVEEASRKGDACDVDEISATETEETPQSQSRISKARKRVWKRPSSAQRPVSPVEEVLQKGDAYDLNAISDTEDADQQPEAKRANLSTFEKFVDENGLELPRKGKREVPEAGESDLVADIVAVLGSAAKRPLRGCRRSARLAKRAEMRVETVLLDDEDDVGSDDNKASDEDPDKEVLAGSMDVMRHQAVVTLSPLLNTPTTPLVPSQEDLLLGVEKLVLNQCSSVQDSRTPLESARSLHPGPENIDSTCLLKVVSPPRTPPRALMEVHPDKTPGESVCQLSVESLSESPEHARRTAVASDDETRPLLLPEAALKVLSPGIEEDSVSKSEEDVDSVKRKANRPRAIPSVDLDASKSSPQQPTPLPKSAKRVAIEADIFLSPIQQPPPSSSTRRSRRQSRASTAANTTAATITTDANSTLEDSQTVNRSAPSPMFMSPFQRLEAAVHALESQEKGASQLLATSTDLKTSKRLWDTTATYLVDEQVSSFSKLVNLCKGGLIVPAFGNKYFNITARTKGGRKSTGKEALSKRESLKSCASPSRGRRFFASTFAERNKREVEKRFFEVIRKKTANVPSKKKKKADDERQRCKPTSKKKEMEDGNLPDLQLSYLEDSDVEKEEEEEEEEEEEFRPPRDVAGGGDDDDSGCRLQSRPAIRRAAAIARSRILESSIDELNLNDPPITASAVLPPPIPAARKTAKIAKMEVAETVEMHATGSSLNTSHRSALGLFAPTPNTSGVFDFTLSEDDELVRGLPRLGGRNTNMVKKTKGVLLATTPEDSSRPIISAGFLTNMNRCVGVVFSTLNIVESEFSNRLNQLRDQVGEMQRLLRRWQQRRPEDAAEETRVPVLLGGGLIREFTEFSSSAPTVRVGGAA